MNRIKKLLGAMALGAGLFGLTPSAFTHDAPASLEGLPMLQAVAEDAIQISPHIPGMGAHWARQADLPVGPIYCVIEGRVVCIEYMFTMEEFQAGIDWVGLTPGMKTPPISHIDVEFKPEGVGPNPVPLYQVHVYFAAATLLERH